MSNKTQLQQNNTELQAHLQDILGLPTAAEIAAGASTGQYGWKKYEYTPAETIQVINPKSTLTYYKSDSFKVLSDDYNVNSVDISFFNGFTLAVAKYDQYIINDGYVTINGSNTEVVYDKTNAILTVKGVTYSSSDSGTLNYNGIKTYEKEEKIGGLIGYIVSDSPTAYPNDGVQDGFWYERIDKLQKGLNIFKSDPETGKIIDAFFNFEGLKASLNINPSPESMFYGMKNVEIVASESTYYSNLNVLGEMNSISGKLKVKIGSIQTTPYYGGLNTKAPKVWIGNETKSILLTSSTTGDYASGLNYINGENCTFYCEPESKPNGWHSYWNYYGSNYKNSTVIWGVTEEQFDAM